MRIPVPFGYVVVELDIANRAVFITTANWREVNGYRVRGISGHLRLSTYGCYLNVSVDNRVACRDVIDIGTDWHLSIRNGVETIVREPISI